MKKRQIKLQAGTALHALALVSLGASASALAPVAALAQDYTQVNATGRVVGTDGNPIAGATVTVQSNAQGFKRTVKVDENGSYRVTALPQGAYTFTVEAPGFEPFTDTNVTLTQGSAGNQFALAPTGTSNNEIVVTAGRVKVNDFDRLTTGAVINVAQLAQVLPVGRDLTSIVLLAPGATAGDSRFGSLPSINGSSVSENAFFLNGLETTQFRNGLGAVAVPFDFYQIVEVKRGATPAEFGRFTGGFINATTKSGSNEFHGSVRVNWEPNWARSKAPNTYASDNDSSFAQRKDFVVELSGPIIKDHLFFYGLYNSRDVTSGGGSTGTISSTSAVCNQGFCADFADLASANQKIAGTSYVIDTNTSPFYGGKLDAIITDGQRLEATYWDTRGTTTRQTFGTAASGLRYNLNTNAPGNYDSTTVFRSGGENYVFRYTGTFTNWLTLSAAYGVNKNRDTTESNRADFPSITDQRNGANASIGNNTANSSRNFDKRTFYRADFDTSFELLGKHHIRGGYDRQDLDEDSTTSANGGFQYTLGTATGAATTIDPTVNLPGGSNYAVARTFVSGGQFTTRNTAFYIQDNWSLFGDRLQLNLGIRNDQFESRNGDGETFFKAKNQWGPRIGAALDPWGDSKTKIWGAFSRYFLPVAVNTNVRLAGSELDYDKYYALNGLNANGTPNLGAALTGGSGWVGCPGGGGVSCVIRNDGTVPDTASVVASNLKPQSVDEFVVGAERRFGSRIKVSAYYTRTKLNNSLEDAALDQAIVPYCVAQGKAATACRAIWGGVHQYALINPGRDVAVTLSDPLPGETNLRTVTLSSSALGYPRAQRTYDGVTLTFDREFDGKWSLQANYTWSKLRGNIEGGVRSDNAQTDSGLTTSFDLPALVNGTYGDLPNDRRHVFKTYGVFKPVKWLTLSGNYVLQSPRSFGCYGRAPANADYDATAPGGLAGLNYGAGAAYCNVANGKVVRNPVGYSVVNPSYPSTAPSTLQLTPRGSQFKSDWLSQLDLETQLDLPNNKFGAYVRLSVFNILNSKAKLRMSETGTSSGGAPLMTYSLVTQYQAARSGRIQFGMSF